jgi:imidazole glycerol-phosphate synthase subunit HisF
MDCPSSGKRAHVKRIRVIPVLLVRNGDLVKTKQFGKPVYIGDPINAVRIFNDKRVDELILLDIRAAEDGWARGAQLVAEIAGEAFMPVAYGGGIRSLPQIEQILQLGVEKVVINSAAVSDLALVTEAARQFGSQSVVVSIDARTRFGRSYRVFINGGRTATKLEPAKHARRCADAGAGEILITAIAREGTFEGYDLALTRTVAEAVDLPVIACGGAATVDDFARAVNSGGAAAVAASSMFVFQGTHRAVRISFPNEALLSESLYDLV